MDQNIRIKLKPFKLTSSRLSRQIQISPVRMSIQVLQDCANVVCLLGLESYQLEGSLGSTVSSSESAARFGCLPVFCFVCPPGRSVDLVTSAQQVLYNLRKHNSLKLDCCNVFPSEPLEAKFRRASDYFFPTNLVAIQKYWRCIGCGPNQQVQIPHCWYLLLIKVSPTSTTSFYLMKYRQITEITTLHSCWQYYLNLHR